MVPRSGTGGTTGGGDDGPGGTGTLPGSPDRFGTRGVTMYRGAETEMMEAGCCIAGQFAAGFNGGATGVGRTGATRGVLDARTGLGVSGVSARVSCRSSSVLNGGRDKSRSAGWSGVVSPFG